MIDTKVRRARKGNRLKGYNYSQNGYYFVTICVKDKFEYFGKIENGKMVLNRYGEIARNYWVEIPKHYKNVTLDEFIVMPNHIHGIVVIENNNVGTEHCSVPTVKNYGLLSKILKSFKNIVTKNIHEEYNDYNFQWQRSFYDHVIRNEKSLNNIREYIRNNPLKWDFDRNNPKFYDYHP